jgi:hypothetical protein
MEKEPLVPYWPILNALEMPKKDGMYRYLEDTYICIFFAWGEGGQSRDSSVSIALGYRLDDWGSRVRFPAGAGIFLFTTASRMALGSTQPPIQWVPGALSLEVKRPGHEADHSPPSSAEVKNAWSYISTPPIHLHGVVLSKRRYNFTFSWGGSYNIQILVIMLKYSLTGVQNDEIYEVQSDQTMQKAVISM